MKRKLISLLLVLAMCLSILPASVLASEAELDPDMKLDSATITVEAASKQSPSGEDGEKLFDKNVRGSKWCVVQSKGWLGFSTQEPMVLLHMKGYFAKQSDNADVNMSNIAGYKLQAYTGSDAPAEADYGDDAKWQDIGVVTDNAESILVTALNMTKPSRYFRLEVTDPGPKAENAIRFYELELFGMKPEGADVSFAPGAIDGVEISGTMAPAPAYKHCSYVLPECSYEPGNSEYVFCGWKIDDSQNLQPGTTVPISGPITLTAQWMKAAVVTFAAEAPAEGVKVQGEMPVQKICPGTYTLPACDFSAEGYVHSHWNVVIDGTEAVIMLPGDTIETAEEMQITATAIFGTKPEAPVLTLPEGVPAEQMPAGTLLTMTAAEKCTIWYTVDGSDPSDRGNENRKQYTEAVPMTLLAPTVKAVAVIRNRYSDPVEQRYTVKYETVSKKFIGYTGAEYDATVNVLPQSLSGKSIMLEMDQRYTAVADLTLERIEVQAGAEDKFFHLNLTNGVTLTVEDGIWNKQQTSIQAEKEQKGVLVVNRRTDDHACIGTNSTTACENINMTGGIVKLNTTNVGETPVLGGQKGKIFFYNGSVTANGSVGTEGTRIGIGNGSISIGAFSQGAQLTFRADDSYKKFNTVLQLEKPLSEAQRQEMEKTVSSKGGFILMEKGKNGYSAGAPVVMYDLTIPEGYTLEAKQPITLAEGKTLTVAKGGKLIDYDNHIVKEQVRVEEGGTFLTDWAEQLQKTGNQVTFTLCADFGKVSVIAAVYENGQLAASGVKGIDSTAVGNRVTVPLTGSVDGNAQVKLFILTADNTPLHMCKEA